MRRLLLLSMLLIAALAAVAQKPTTLSLSKCALVIKVTDPLRQVTTFDPLISRIDDFISAINPQGPNVSDKLTDMLTKVTKAPGVNGTGDFWFVLPEFAKFTPPVAATPEDGVAKPAMPMCYLLVPLTDAQQFRAVLEKPEVKAAVPAKSTVLEKCALFALNSTEDPKFDTVILDTKLVGKSDVIITWQGSLMPSMPEFTADNNPAMVQVMPILEPITKILEEAKQNQQAGEVGLTMEGDDLIAETYITPVPGSPLAKTVTETRMTALPLELAGYLPENLAYVCTSDGKLAGAPGMGDFVIRGLFTGLVSMALEPAQQKTFVSRLNALNAQLSQGRAIGVTAPPANTLGDVAVVGVYHVENPKDAAAAVQNFAQEVIRARDSALGGMMTKIVKIFNKPNAEIVGEVNVELYKLGMVKQSGPNPNNATLETLLEVRVAYLADKMLMTAGSGGKEQMAALITRIQKGTPGFTSSKRFIQMKANLPENLHSFEALETLDIARAGVNAVPIMPTEMKQTAIKYLGVFPSHRTMISTYTEYKDGYLHGNSRLPGEHLDFFLSLIKVMLTRANNAPLKPEPEAE